MKLSKIINKFKILAVVMAVIQILTVSVFASGEILSLYKNKETDNIPFHVVNMFPGDYVKQNYCVRVSYNGTIDVFFRAKVRPGYEKLAEVLKCTVTLDGGTLLYTGLMRDMPAIPRTISAVNTTEDLNYEIQVYLDTSVGNDYKDLDLIADFEWWAEAEEKDDDGGSGGGGGGLPVGPDTPVNPPVDPDNPDAPDTPDVPDAPDNPDIPDTPDTPGTDHPGIPGTDTPGAEPGVPSDKPSDSPASPDAPSDGKKPTGELISPPNTGDFKNPAIYIAAICISLFIIFLILFIRKKNKGEKNRTIRRLTIAIAVIIVLAVCLCITTFALIYSIVTVDENVFSTGTVKINLNDENPIITPEEFLFEPGMTVRKEFFIKNESSDAVYYKVYFENVNGGLADVLEVTISDKETGELLYSGTAGGLDRESCDSRELRLNERRELYATFHFPEESGNNMQNSFLEFDMCATATQVRNNPNREF